jgi:hypothetical protein
VGSQIIQQPDGRLALWSSIVDDWVLYDASPEALVEHMVEIAANDARRKAEQMVAAVVEGEPERIYHQFAMTFEAAQELRARIHGEAPWPPE